MVPACAMGARAGRILNSLMSLPHVESLDQPQHGTDALIDVKNAAEQHLSGDIDQDN